jgi:hypothetical protein
MVSEIATASIEPIAPDSPERLLSLDFIRGIAVMGILGANVIAFGQPFVAYYWPGGFATPPELSDPWLWTLQFLLVDGKMRGLFTIARRRAARAAGSRYDGSAGCSLSGSRTTTCCGAAIS